MSNTRKLYPVAILALVLSIGSLFMIATPCQIAHGQTICDVGDDETISTSLTLENELNIGATPSPGTLGQVVTSRGANTSPEWRNAFLTDVVVHKASDQSVANNSLVNDNDFNFGVLDDNSTYHFRGVWFVDCITTSDLKFNFTTTVYETHGLISQDSTTILNVEDSAYDIVINTSNSGSGRAHFIDFILKTSTLSGSPFILSWAQNVTDGANPCVMRAGSWMSYAKIN